ncbi:MAG: hypothetical protein JXQ90_11920 [Cyclobacteriaceae bacterium]
MFRFFKINDPYRLVFVLAILVVVRIVIGLIGLPISLPEFTWLLTGERLANGFLMYKEAYTYLSPLAGLIYKYLDFMFGNSRIAHWVFSTLVIFINATIFSVMMVRNKAFKENNYLIGLFYVLLMMAIPDFMSLSPMLMSSTFILLALNHVIRRIDNKVTDELFLFAGIYLGIATIIYVPAAIYFIVLLLSFILFSAPIARRILLYFYGYLLPILITAGLYYWNDGLSYMIYSVYSRGLLNERIWYADLVGMLIAFAVPLFWIVIAMYNTWVKGRYTSFGSKINQVMFLIFLSGVIVVWIDVELSTPQLAYFVIPGAFYLTQYALLLKKRLFLFVLPFLIIGSLIATPFFIYNYIDKSILLTQPLNPAGSTGQKVMVLSDDPGLYYDRAIAGPAIDKELTIRYLQDIDHYPNALTVYNALINDLPEVIVDDWGLMEKLFFRFPILAEKYRQGKGNRYYLKTSN